MKKGAMFLLLLWMFLLPMSAAGQTTNQGLYWAVENGDRFDCDLSYHRTGSSETVDISERVHFIIDLGSAYSTIPDPVDHPADLFRGIFVAYWENDSIIQYLFQAWIFYIIPVGNWSLVSEVFETGHDQYGAVVTNTETVWRVEYNPPPNSNPSEFILEIVKEDGALGYLHHVGGTSDPAETITLEVTRVGYERLLSLEDDLFLLFVGIALVAGIAVVAVLWVKRR